MPSKRGEVGIKWAAGFSKIKKAKIHAVGGAAGRPGGGAAGPRVPARRHAAHGTADGRPERVACRRGPRPRLHPHGRGPVGGPAPSPAEPLHSPLADAAELLSGIMDLFESPAPYRPAPSVSCSLPHRVPSRPVAADAIGVASVAASRKH